MGKLHKPNTNIYSTEVGMIAIFTTMILMIVISLVVLGFAELSRHNQVDTLDLQLSSQAYYAAETGINDARTAINNFITNKPGLAVPSTSSSCTPPSNNGAGNPYSNIKSEMTIDASKNIGYTCLTINATPSALTYSDVGSNGVVVPITDSSNNNINTITLTVTSKEASSTPSSGCSNFKPSNGLPTATVWTNSGCGYGLLRFDIIPAGTTSYQGLTGPNSLASDTMTEFVFPEGGANPLPLTYPTSGSKVTDTQCNDSLSAGCVIKITTPGTTSSYYLRIMSLYVDVGLQVNATDSNGSVAFGGAQAVIDSTGQAQNVLRRLEVTIPLLNSSQNQLPNFALETTDSICKQFPVIGAPGNSLQVHPGQQPLGCPY